MVVIDHINKNNIQMTVKIFLKSRGDHFGPSCIYTTIAVSHDEIIERTNLV